LALVSATSAEVARTVFRVWLRTRTFKPEEYHTAFAARHKKSNVDWCAAYR
jgi:hypothetical protein